MVASLVDTATPGLTAFVNILESLGPKVTGLANRFNTLERNIAKVGTALESSTPNLEKFSGSVDKVNVSTGTLEKSLGALPGVVDSLVSSLQSASRVIEQVAGTLNTLSSASKKASDNVGGATSSLSAMGNVVNGVTTQVRTLHGVMEGLAAQWASMKIFEAGKASVDEASEFQLVQKKVAALNFGQGQNAEIQKDANDLAKRMGISVREGLEAYMSAISGLAVTDYTGSKKAIQATLDEAIKTAIILRLRGDTSSIKDLTRNLYGVVEARGQTSDPEAAIRTMELIQKNSVATGGKLTTKDVETIFRQLKDGLGTTISDDGMLRVFALANQMKASGSGGGGGGGMGVSQAGTAVTQVYKWAAGGVLNKDAIRTLEAMGYIKQDASRDDSGTTKDNIAPGSIKNAALAVSDPMLFLEQMAPYALALAMKNKDLFFGAASTDDPKAIDEALSKVAMLLFKNVNQANMAVQAWNPGSASRIESEVKLTNQSKGTDEAKKDIEETYRRNVEKFDAAVKTFETTVGTTLLPIITPVVVALTDLLGFFDRVAAANPVATTLTQIALAVSALGLALFSLQKMFGVFTMISTFAGYLTAVGPAATVAAEGAGAVAVAATSLTGVLMTCMKVLGRAAGIVGALILLYDTLLMVMDVKVWGVTVGTWFASWVDAVSKDVDRLKVGFKELFGVTSSSEAKKMREEIDALQKRNREANGIYDDPSKDSKSPRVSVGKITQIGATKEAPKESAEVSKEKALLEQLKAEAAKLEAKILDLKKPVRGYNTIAGQDQQEVRIEESGMRADLKILDAERKAALVSDEEYYRRKEEILNTRYDAMISSLRQKLKDLRPNQLAQRDKAKTDIDIKEQEKAAALESMGSDKERSATEYKVAMAKVESILDEAQGRRHEARLDRLKQELILLEKRATLNGKSDDVAKIQKAMSTTNAAIGYEDTFRDYEKVNNKVIQQMDIIDAKVKAGMMTETDAANQKYELRRTEAAQLDEILAKLTDLAAATGDEKLTQKIELLKIQMQGYATALSPTATKMKGILENGFSTFFTDITSKNKSLKASFQDLFNSIQAGVMQLISKQLSEQLFKSLFGGSGATSGGAGGGGLFGGLFGSLFGGGGDVPVTAASSANVSAMQAEAALELASFDVGTNRVPFDMIAKVHKDEIIVPAGDRDKAIAAWSGGSSGGGVSVTNHFTVQGNVDRRTQAQIAAYAARSVQSAQRNL
jgi:hypothetical protein